MRTCLALVLVLSGCDSPSSLDGAALPDATSFDGGARDAPRMDAEPEPDAALDPLDVSAFDGAARDDAPMMRPDAPSPSDAGVDARVDLDAGPASARQTQRVIGYEGSPNGFYEYLPPGYDGTTPMPLLLFWHGQDEDGDGSATELPRVLRNGPPDLIDRDAWPAERPFIVLSPQNGGTGCPSAGTVRTFLRWAFDHYPVDRARVYLTGLSCGAIGSWAYINAYLGDGEITAAVLIAGKGRSSWTRHGCGLNDIGIWAFHGTSDGTINPDDEMFVMTGFPTDDRADRSATASQLAYDDWVTAGMPTSDGLLGCPAGGRDAQLTLYPGVGHNSWGRTYDGSAGHDIYAWMLSMAR